MSKENEVDLHAVAAAAKRKRTKDLTRGLKVTGADILKIPPPLPDSAYCQVCQYPKIRGVWGECSNCETEAAANQTMARRYADAIGGMKGWKEYTEWNLDKPNMGQAALFALAAAKTFNPKKDNLLLYGPRGTGKSHIAGICKRRLILAGVNVQTISMPDILGDIMAAFGKGGSRADEYVKRYTSVPVLSVEDVGAGEKATEYVIKFYFRLIDGRYKEDRNGLIITLNDPLEVLEDQWSRYDSHGRVTNRLKEMCRTFSFMGEKDWRAEKAARRDQL